MATDSVTGVRPVGDNVADPATVVNPDFGCAFSDKTAQGGTQPLFALCPTG